MMHGQKNIKLKFDVVHQNIVTTNIYSSNTNFFTTIYYFK